MRVCLMIEGQEDVTWDQWLALAGACEEHGLEGLFRSDHYAPIGSGPSYPARRCSGGCRKPSRGHARNAADNKRACP